MPPPRSSTLATGHLLRVRARARAGLLASLAGTIAVAVATIGTLGMWLLRGANAPAAARPAGMSDDEFAAQVEEGARALAAGAPGLVLVVALLAATAVSQLGRLLAIARDAESTFARARGLSHRQASVAAAAESAAVAAVGAVAGIAAAGALTAALSAGDADSLGAVLSRPGAALVAAGAVVLALLLGAVATRSARHARRRPLGRAARAAGVALVVAVLLAAGFVLWQLRFVQAAPGTFDPVVAVAPAVLLSTAGILAVALFASFARVVAGIAAHRRSLSPALPARQASRGVAVYRVAVLLVAFAAAQTVFGSCFTATWQHLVAASTAVETGADLRVDLDTDAANPRLVAAISAVDGVEAAGPALIAPVEAGSTGFELIALSGSTIPGIVSSAGGAVDPLLLQTQVSEAADAVDLGSGATALRLTVDVTSPQSQAAGLVELSALVADATGATARLRFAGAVSAAADGTTRVAGEAPLPEGTAPWDLLAVTAQFRASIFSPTATVSLASLESVGGAGDLGITGTVDLTGDEPEGHLWLADPVVGGEEPPPTPVVVSSALAGLLGLADGDTLDIRYTGSGRSGSLVVAGTADAVPGAGSALAAFADLTTLRAAMLRSDVSVISPSSVWASGDSSAAAAVSAAVGDREVRTAAPGVAASIAAALLPAWGIATGGGLVLALIAVLAIVQTLARGRRAELAALRAVGVTPRAQGRMRAAELVEVTGFALLAGAIAGSLAAWSVVPDLARAAAAGVRAPLAVPAVFDPLPLVAGLGLLAVGLAAIIALAARQVARQARTAVGVEASG
jgi:hypothetical protein